MPDALSFDAVLLAAGKSTRMGTDKALLDASGMELWRRQWAVLVQAKVQTVYLSVNAAQTWAPPGITTVSDAEPGLGPLGGIVAALEKTKATHLMVLAVDLPQMVATWFRLLAADCVPGSGASGRLDNFYEPLAAIYPREILPMAREALMKRVLSLQKLLSQAERQGLMRVREIGAQERAFFKNWNEPVDRK